MLSNRGAWRGYAIAIALLVGAAGAAIALIRGPTQEESSPARLVPRSAHLYWEAPIGPGTFAERSLRRVAQRLTGQRLREGELVETLLQATGPGTHGRVQAWLGDVIAGFQDRRGQGFVAEATDGTRALAFAREALDAKSGGAHRGVRYVVAADGRAAALVRHHLVFGDSTELVRAAIDADQDGRSLAETPAYSRADSEDPGVFVTAVADVRMPEKLVAGGTTRPEGAHLLRRLAGVGGILTARAMVARDSLTFEVAGLRKAGTAPTLEHIPDQAWFALSSPDLGGLLLTVLKGGSRWSEVSRFVREHGGADLADDLIGQIGPGTLFAQGGGAKLSAEAHDRDVLQKSALRLAKSVRAPGGPKGVVVPELAANIRSAEPFVQFNIGARDPASPLGLYVDLEDERINVSFGGSTGSGGYLGDTELYRRARRLLGGAPQMVVETAPARKVLGHLGLADASTESRALRRIEFVAGRHRGGTARFVAGLAAR